MHKDFSKKVRSEDELSKQITKIIQNAHITELKTLANGVVGEKLMGEGTKLFKLARAHY